MSLRLLFLCDEYPPGRHGGIGTIVRSMAQALARQGHRVTVAGAYLPGYGGPDRCLDEGVEVHRFRLETEARSRLGQTLLRLARSFGRRTGLLPPKGVPNLAPFRAYVGRLLREQRTDLLVQPDYQAYLGTCTRYVPPPRRQVPTVAVLHGSQTFVAEQDGRVPPEHVVRMDRDTLREVTDIVGVSRHIADWTARRFALDRPITVLHNGVPAWEPPAGQARHDLQAVFTGTLIPRKGIDSLLRAWNLVQAELPAARLAVLGKGDIDRCRAILTPAAAPSVRFLGHTDRETLRRHLAESAVGVFPSYAETFGLAPIEAMQAGTATIFTTRASGAELIEHGRDGLLIDPDDIPGLAAALLRLFRDRPFRERLARAGQERVRACFGIDRVAAAYAAHFRAVLNRVGASAGWSCTGRPG